MKNIFKAVMISIGLLGISVSIEAKEAKKKGPGDDLIDWELCRTNPDSDVNDDVDLLDMYCCSESEGYCIVCPRDAGSCTKTSYRSTKSDKNALKSRSNTAAGDFIAPAPVSPSPRDRLKRKTAPAFPAKNMSPTKTTPTIKMHPKQKPLKTNTQYK